MSLTREEFHMLVLYDKEWDKQKEDSVIHQLGITEAKRRAIKGKFQEEAYIDGFHLTQKGRAELEPYRAKRAIIVAAGIGSRLAPVTLHTPKPLVRVNGVRIIDTILDALLAAEIYDITIVRGYLGEVFDELLEKYPMIKFVENPEYREANNISSLYRVREHLENAYILDGDLIINNSQLITKYQYTTNYVGIYTEETDDWVVSLDENGYITQMKLGGKKEHLMYDVTYWSKEDGKRLGQQIVEVYHSKEGKQAYWDEVAIGYFTKDYKIEVREFDKTDIIEIDNYWELQQLDTSYQ